jgi:hypothetical protein
MLVDNTRNRRQPDLIIPAGLRTYKELTWLDKVLLAEITSLDGPDGCYASNEYLAEFLGTNTRSVSRTVSRLVELAFVTLHWKAHPFRLGKQRILHSRLDERLVELQAEGKTPKQHNPSILATLGAYGDATLGESQDATLGAHSYTSFKGTVVKRERTTEPVPSGRAGSSGQPFSSSSSENVGSWSISNQIAEKLSLPRSEGRIIKREVLNDFTTTDKLLAEYYDRYSAFTPESINAVVWEGVCDLVRITKRTKRDDQLLFLTQYLHDRTLRPAADSGLAPATADSPEFPEWQRRGFATDLVMAWNPNASLTQKLL